jgi:hypothetical protein
MIYLTGFGFIFIGKVSKFEALIKQSSLGNRSFTRRVEGFQYSSVFSQNVIYIPHKFILIRILFVEIRCTALIAAELFIFSSVKSISAFQTIALFHLQAFKFKVKLKNKTGKSKKIMKGNWQHEGKQNCTSKIIQFAVS